MAARLTARHDSMVYAFGDATFRGSMAGKPLAAPIVAMASTPDGAGYWLVGSDGGVYAFGARFYGSLSRTHLVQPIVGVAATSSGRGYWLLARDGGVFAFGDAAFRGSLGGSPLHAPMTAIVAAPRAGYWLVARDGGVFAFGGAPFYGSAADRGTTAAFVSLSPDASGRGYWLAASDGQVFGFGAAQRAALVRPRAGTRVIGVARAGTRGFWLAGRDGGIFSFAGALFHGSAAGMVRDPERVAAIDALPDGHGYRLLASMPTAPPDGITALGDSVMLDAASALQTTIPGTGVDAATARAPGTGVDIMRVLAAGGHLGGAVIWHLGTNGTLTPAMIDQVLAVAAGRRVVMVTDHCPYCSWTPGNNAAIAAMCTEARNCGFADWNGLADANPGWFGRDGVHMPLGGAGAQAYAQLVAAQL